ncbi:proton-conducting membrane transporter [Haladaptatus cibarius]|uniref:proton-conducting membrane transporter n=1 Tax=Haladaptatus cibarius TaxID=453847 RepID=UPI001B80C135|nr:proton-conducting membrane transporter [Haladaptatus cibarius]
MTSKPRLHDTSTMLPGLVAVALFGVLAVVFLGASFGDAAGFPSGAGITAGIGYAMFNITSVEGQNIIPSEGFLVAFLIIALVLDAALDGAVLLASREEDGESTRQVATDGGMTGGDDE